MGNVTQLADVSSDDFDPADFLSVCLRAPLADVGSGERWLQRALSAGHHLADDRVDGDAGGFDAIGDRVRLDKRDRRPVALTAADLVGGGAEISLRGDSRT